MTQPPRDDATDYDDGYDAPNPLVPGGHAPHAPAGDLEEVYYEGSPLLRGELGLLTLWFVVAVVLAGIGIGIAYYQDWATTALLIAAGFLLAAALALFVPALWVRRHRYRITNYRIDLEHGLISNNVDTLELWHVNDIRFRQGPLDRIFRVGTITIDSDDRSTPHLELKSLPNPRPLFDSLKQRVISVKRQRGVIKMDMGGMG
jgi:membrane protein YdbS with pleckstrin-like domain